MRLKYLGTLAPKYSKLLVPIHCMPKNLTHAGELYSRGSETSSRSPQLSRISTRAPLVGPPPSHLMATALGASARRLTNCGDSEAGCARSKFHWCTAKSTVARLVSLITVHVYL